MTDDDTEKDFFITNGVPTSNKSFHIAVDL